PGCGVLVPNRGGGCELGLPCQTCPTRSAEGTYWAASTCAVKLNGRDITAAFHPDLVEHALIGLVAGLSLGQNRLEVFANSRSEEGPAEHLTITNHPITGPVFSGPQERPFRCSTELFKAAGWNCSRSASGFELLVEDRGELCVQGHAAR